MLLKNLQLFRLPTNWQITADSMEDDGDSRAGNEDDERKAA